MEAEIQIGLGVIQVNHFVDSMNFTKKIPNSSLVNDEPTLPPDIAVALDGLPEVCFREGSMVMKASN